MLLAVTLTAIGFAYDAGAGNKELSMVFSASYALACIVAVLAVRQSGVFTAVIQPPLILFAAVPTAYFLFHGGHLDGIKDLAINCGYPLIERFPLMFFTSAAVLLIGMGRWYYGMSSRRGAGESTPKDGSAAKNKTGGRVSSVTSKMSSLLTGEATEADEQDDNPAESPRRKHTIDRASRAAKAKPAAETARTPRAVKRPAPSRSRHTRPPDTELIEPVVERPRRPRTARQRDEPSIPPAEPRRRARPSSTREPRKAVPPVDRRTGYERPERRRRYDDYAPREQQTSNGNGTHHPFSQVRYRGADDSDDRAEERTRPPRSSRNGREADSWEYDI